MQQASRGAVCRYDLQIDLRRSCVGMALDGFGNEIALHSKRMILILIRKMDNCLSLWHDKVVKHY